jgi:hypothetical protein
VGWQKVDEIAAPLHARGDRHRRTQAGRELPLLMRIRITEADIPRVSNLLGMKHKEFIASDLRRDEGGEDDIKTSPPCPLSQRHPLGDLCSQTRAMPRLSLPRSPRSPISSFLHAHNAIPVRPCSTWSGHSDVRCGSDRHALPSKPTALRPELGVLGQPARRRCFTRRATMAVWLPQKIGRVDGAGGPLSCQRPKLQTSTRVRRRR